MKIRNSRTILSAGICGLAALLPGCINPCELRDLIPTSAEQLIEDETPVPIIEQPAPATEPETNPPIIEPETNCPKWPIYVENISESEGGIIESGYSNGSPDYLFTRFISETGTDRCRAIFTFPQNIDCSLTIYIGGENLPDRPYICSVGDVSLIKNDSNGQQQRYFLGSISCSMDKPSFDISSIVKEAGGGIRSVEISQTSRGYFNIDALESHAAEN